VAPKDVGFSVSVEITYSGDGQSGSATVANWSLVAIDAPFMSQIVFAPVALCATGRRPCRHR